MWDLNLNEIIINNMKYVNKCSAANSTPALKPLQIRVYFPIARRARWRAWSVCVHKLNCMTSMSRSVVRARTKNTCKQAHLSCVKACVYALRSSASSSSPAHINAARHQKPSPPSHAPNGDVNFHATRVLSSKHTNALSRRCA